MLLNELLTIGNDMVFGVSWQVFFQICIRPTDMRWERKSGFLSYSPASLGTFLALRYCSPFLLVFSFSIGSLALLYPPLPTFCMTN